MIPFLVLVAIAAASAWLAGRLALQRGRNFTAWAWLGALFGPFAVIAVALLPAPKPA